MSEAKLGLIIVALIISAFAVMMRRMGAITTTGTVSAIIISVLIASYLFVLQ